MREMVRKCQRFMNHHFKKKDDLMNQRTTHIEHVTDENRLLREANCPTNLIHCM